jgi:XTP/dITP diphosphohydrolase
MGTRGENTFIPTFTYSEKNTMNKIVLATGNQGKVREMADLLSDFGFEVLAQSEFNVSDVAETGTTFIENAIIKARHAAQETGLPAIADDSGLEVDALKGAPGIYSARYAGEGASDLDNLNKLLEELKDVPEAERTARFHCVLVMMRHADDPTPIVCHGTWEGRILNESQGSNGFGYDPVFFVPEKDCASAELEPVVKKQLSHRGKALQQLFATLKQS